MSDDEEVVLSSDAEEVIMLLGEFHDEGIEPTDEDLSSVLEWSIDRVNLALIELMEKELVTKGPEPKAN